MSVLKRLDELALEMRAVEKRHAKRLEAIERRLYDIEHEQREPLRVGPSHEPRTSIAREVLRRKEQREFRALAKKLGFKLPVPPLSQGQE